LSLARQGRNARWYHEHERDHPVLAYGEVAELLTLRPDPFEQRVAQGWRDIVDGVTSATATAQPGVLIIEGAFFQIPVGVMLAMDVPVARIRALLLRIDAMLSEAGASLIHLTRPDLHEGLREIGDVRGRQWLDEMIGVVSQSGYGRRHRVRDVNGLARFYDRQRSIIASVWPRLTVRRTEIAVGGARWTRAHRRMAAFTRIADTAATPLSSRALIAHAGIYRGPRGQRAVVTTDGRDLYLQRPATQAAPLLRVSDDRFSVESLPIDIQFRGDARGRVRAFRCETRLVNEPRATTRWRRV
jgi:hypothetical protein